MLIFGNNIVTDLTLIIKDVNEEREFSLKLLVNYATMSLMAKRILSK